MWITSNLGLLQVKSAISIHIQVFELIFHTLNIPYLVLNLYSTFHFFDFLLSVFSFVGFCSHIDACFMFIFYSFLLS